MTTDELKMRLDRVKQVLDSSTTKETEMAAPKKTATKKPAAKKDNGEVGTPVAKTKKVKQSEDTNLVTLAALAKEVGMTPQAARRKLRSAKLQRDGRWSWKVDSDELEEAREALTTEPDAEAA